MKQDWIDILCETVVSFMAAAMMFLFLTWLTGCGVSRSRYGFVTDLDADEAADCLVAELEAQGLTQPGIAASTLRTATVTITTYEEPEIKAPGIEVSGLSDAHRVFVLIAPGSDPTKSSLQHELVHVILCNLQHCDQFHEARAWWVPVTEPAKKCWADLTP